MEELKRQMALNRGLIFAFLLCLGCTHAPVKLAAGDCPTRAIFGVKNPRSAYVVEHEFWSTVEAQKILLSDILKQGAHSCDELVRVDWEVIQTPADVFFSLLPMVSRGRIVVRYELE